MIVIFSKANDNSVGCEDHAEDGLVDVDDLWPREKKITKYR